jgi:hypothetical protein
MKTVRKRKTADERKIDRFLRDYMQFVISRLRQTPMFPEFNVQYKPKKNTKSMIHKRGGYVLDERALDKYVNTALGKKKSGILQIDSSAPVPRLLNPRFHAPTRRYKILTPIGAEKVHADAKRIHVDVEKIRVDHATLLRALENLINAFSAEILAFELYDRILERGLREQLNVAFDAINAYVAKGPVPKEWNYLGDIYRSPPVL